MTLKVLNVRDGDYRIQVQSGGTITLDTQPTGGGQGTVRITGDLLVEGNTTTVQSETMTVTDNIIVLNDGDTGNGITLGTAGIEINRGNYPDVRFLFDETLSHLTSSGSSQTGTWVLRSTAGGSPTMGLKLSSVVVDSNADLYLINQGTGVLSVTGTVNYEANVSDDDDIPNLRYLLNYVAATGGVAAVDKFYSFDAGTVTYYDTGGRAYDTDNGDPVSRVVFEVDGVEKGEFNSNGLEVDDVNIAGSKISTINTNADLLVTSQSGRVEIDAYALYTDQSSVDPTPIAGTTILYSKTETTGGRTGLYFAKYGVDTDGSTAVTLTDELVSRRRSLVFSYIF
jgi:hypothetical protein